VRAVRETAAAVTERDVVRRLNIMLAPGLITEISLRKARARTLRGTCIHTALTQTRSKVSFERSTFSSAGRVSFIQRMSGDRRRSCPAARNCAAGSTATTLCPSAANHAASHPMTFVPRAGCST